MSKWCEKCTYEPYGSCGPHCPAFGLSIDEAFAKLVMPHNNRSKAEQCLIDKELNPMKHLLFFRHWVTFFSIWKLKLFPPEATIQYL